MHLDTVFTMIDYNKFTIHPEIESGLKVYEITKGEDGQINIDLTEGTLENVLANALGVDQVTLIRTGGDDIVAAAREQWKDCSNNLTIAPGVVVFYDLTKVIHKNFDTAGVNIIKLCVLD